MAKKQPHQEYPVMFNGLQPPQSLKVSRTIGDYAWTDRRDRPQKGVLHLAGKGPRPADVLFVSPCVLEEELEDRYQPPALLKGPAASLFLRNIKAGSGIEAGWGIEAGRGIEAGWGIKAGSGIEAGRGIKAGSGIEAGDGILTFFRGGIVAKWIIALRVAVGFHLKPDEEIQTVKAELRDGTPLILGIVETS